MTRLILLKYIYVRLNTTVCTYNESTVDTLFFPPIHQNPTFNPTPILEASHWTFPPIPNQIPVFTTLAGKYLPRPDRQT